MDEEAKNDILDKAMTKLKAERKGARVFCVRCGAGQRTPLRKWHNSYICQECWKILKAVGEEEFRMELERGFPPPGVSEYLDENGLPYYSNHAERLVKED